MTTRGHISLKEKLASALCQMLCDDGAGNLVPIIPYEDAKQMTADQVLSLWQWDHHPIRKADGGSDRHFNLVPRLILAHRKKTAEKDAPEMAHTRALTKQQEDFRRKALARPCGQKRERTGNWPRGRKMQSRGFQRRPA